jgi:Peptidase family C25
MLVHMNTFSKHLFRLSRSLTTILALILFSLLPFASIDRHALAGSGGKNFDTPFSAQNSQDKLGSSDVVLSSATATATTEGILLEWRTSFERDNLGFNVYRLRDGQQARVNRTIIPGSVFIVGQEPLRGGRSYQWLDPDGTVDSVYYIEAESTNGGHRSYDVAISGKGRTLTRNEASVESKTGPSSGAAQLLMEYPESSAPRQSSSPAGPLQTQWAIAGQAALRIQINRDGWYRLTQQQIAAAGFNPTVDIKNLSLFADGQELAIRTSKSAGQFIAGDYFEFYGRGLDTSTTDTRIYYLIAGAQPGKRTAASVKPESFSLSSAAGPAGETKSASTRQDWFGPLVNFGSAESTSTSSTTEKPKREPARDRNNSDASTVVSSSVETPTVAPASSAPAIPKEEIKKAGPSDVSTTSATPKSIHKGRQATRSRRPASRKRTKSARRRYSHSVSQAVSATNYNYTVQLKERLVYFTQVLNGGDVENWFGQVISLPVSEALTIHNLASSAAGPATLTVALQGIQSSVSSHQVSVFVNDLLVGTLSFFGLDHPVQTFNVPVTQLQEGNNTVKFVHGASGDVSLVDYVTLTYPHLYQAHNGALRFSVPSAQAVTVSGFLTPNVLLLDISDPSNVTATDMVGQTSGAGYAITVAAANSTRSFYALPEQPTKKERGFVGPPEPFPLPVVSVNQPSTLNLANNGADLLIISYKDFIPSLAPLVAQRQSQGLTVQTVDVEDVFDEFSYGAHGSQALVDFLSYTATNWNRTPHYVFLVGDASYDPRNYTGKGYFDFVPTRLIDATYLETCSDDVLTDFNEDGVADIPVGRISARTSAEADLMISKIVNFSKANVPQTALMVADTQGSYYFNFEQAVDEVSALLPPPPNMTVQKVYRRLEPSDAVAHSDIVSKFNQGVAIVNYSGHGNVDTWTGGNIFTTPDARALTNGNKLPFVIVTDCLNGYFDDPALEALAEALLKAPNGGAVASFASSGLTIPDGQHEMTKRLYQVLFGSQSMALGDAIKQAKMATTDMDVRRTWILLGDPSMKIW